MRSTAAFIGFFFAFGMLFAAPQNAPSDGALPQSEADLLGYLSLSDSILNNGLVQGDELARLHLQRGRCFFVLNRPVKALQEFRESTEHTENPELIGQADLESGNIYFEQKSFSRALDFYASSLRLFEASGNRKSMALARFKTAMIHHRQGNDEVAESLLRSVISDPSVDHLRKAHAHETLGEVFFGVASLDSAQAHFEHANAVYAEYGLQEAQLENYERILQTLIAAGKSEEARTVAERAIPLTISLAEGNQNTVFITRVATLFADARDYRQAAEYLEMAKPGVASLPPAQAAELHCQLAVYYGQIERDADALLAFNDAEYLATTAVLPELAEHIARKKADFFKKRKRYEEAFAALVVADSLGKLNLAQTYEDTRRELARGKFAEESYLRTEDDMRTALEESQLATMRNAVIVGVIFFTIIILLLLREFSQKRKLSRILEWKVYKRTRELRKANKELNTYIYKSSHDLRTPLTSIKSLLRLLDKEEHNASTKKYLGLIESCTEQMDDILINLSRAVDYKKVDVKVEQIDFNKLRYQIQEKELAHVKDIRVMWDIQEAGVFFSDFKLIKVILQQTISNAIAYRKGTPDDYCIIKIYTEPSGARITVEDNGQGIAEKVRDKVFDMFVKGTHKSTGAGLGLYLVRIAADKIRAKVRLDSQENEGCKLSFELPNLN